MPRAASTPSEADLLQPVVPADQPAGAAHRVVVDQRRMAQVGGAAQRQRAQRRRRQQRREALAEQLTGLDAVVHAAAEADRDVGIREVEVHGRDAGRDAQRHGRMRRGEARQPRQQPARGESRAHARRPGCRRAGACAASRSRAAGGRNPRGSRARRPRPRSVRNRRRGARRNRRTPRYFSRPLIWWLTAAVVTCSSRAALVKLSRRPAASKARSEFSGGSGGVTVEKT